MVVRIVMALYIEDCTVVRTDAGVSESFEVNQESVLSPRWFAFVMDVYKKKFTRKNLLNKNSTKKRTNKIIIKIK